MSSKSPETEIALLQHDMDSIRTQIGEMDKKLDAILEKTETNFVHKTEYDRELGSLRAEVVELKKRRWIKDVVSPFIVSAVSILLTSLFIYFLHGIGLV